MWFSCTLAFLKKSELVGLYRYGDITAKNEAANNVCILDFTSVYYTLGEDIEADRNKVAFVYPVLNEIYAYLS